jgi:putative ABC transport system substrate-binding protein
MQLGQMRRREFITLLSGAAVAWPVAARAQQLVRPVVGFLNPGSRADFGHHAETFLKGLKESGFTEGENITVEYRWAEGRYERLPQHAEELVKLGVAVIAVGSPPATFAAKSATSRLGELGWVEGRNLQIAVGWAEGRNDRAAEIARELATANVELIVTYATGAALAVKRATTTIPIVFALAADPVGSGLVASLARPGSNATGLSSVNLDLVGKRVELLREIVPGLRGLAVLGNVGVADSAFELREVLKAAETLGLEATPAEIKVAADIAPALETIKTEQQALFVVGDPLTLTNRTQIISWARAQRLPAMYSNRAFVAAGGLMSYGPDFFSLFRRAAELSDKILRGAKPADIPVEQPTKFELVINLRAAKAIALTIPEAFLLRADEVIE